MAAATASGQRTVPVLSLIAALASVVMMLTVQEVLQQGRDLQRAVDQGGTPVQCCDCRGSGRRTLVAGFRGRGYRRVGRALKQGTARRLRLLPSRASIRTRDLSPLAGASTHRDRGGAAVTGRRRVFRRAQGTDRARAAGDRAASRRGSFRPLGVDWRQWGRTGRGCCPLLSGPSRSSNL